MPSVAKRKKRSKEPGTKRERASGRAPGAHEERDADEQPAHESATEPARPESVAGPVLFCPFCRESFEGTDKCPDHELALVPFEKLPSRRTVRDDEVLPLHEWRFGRAIVFAGALLALAGYFLPLSTTTTLHEQTVTGLRLSMIRLPYLWAVPLVSLALVAILFRARTMRMMRSMRLAVPAIALLGATAVGYAAYSIVFGARELAEAAQREIPVQLEIGFWVTMAGFWIAAAGGLLFGRVRHSEELPHGSGPDADGPIGRDE
jgi:hypothetical protein